MQLYFSLLIVPLQLGIPAALAVTVVYWLVISRLAWKLRPDDDSLFRSASNPAHFWWWSLRRLFSDSHYAWVFVGLVGPCVLAVRGIQMFL